MNKRKKRTLIIILLVLVIFFISFTTDFIRAKNNENPIFAVEVAAYEDGGSKKYLGLFYIVYSMHYINPDLNREWQNEDGSLKEEYKDKEYIIYKKVVPWFTIIDKAKNP